MQPTLSPNSQYDIGSRYTSAQPLLSRVSQNSDVNYLSQQGVHVAENQRSGQNLDPRPVRAHPQVFCVSLNTAIHTLAAGGLATLLGLVTLAVTPRDSIENTYGFYGTMSGLVVSAGSMACLLGIGSMQGNNNPDANNNAGNGQQ